MSVVGVSCSPRRTSNTEVLVQRALEGARRNGYSPEPGFAKGRSHLTWTALR